MDQIQNVPMFMFHPRITGSARERRVRLHARQRDPRPWGTRSTGMHARLRRAGSHNARTAHGHFEIRAGCSRRASAHMTVPPERNALALAILMLVPAGPLPGARAQSHVTSPRDDMCRQCHTHCDHQVGVLNVAADESCHQGCEVGLSCSSCETCHQTCLGADACLQECERHCISCETCHQTCLGGADACHQGCEHGPCAPPAQAACHRGGPGITLVDYEFLDFPPGDRHYSNDLDCSCELSCSDPAQVPTVTFSTFQTESYADFVLAYDSGRTWASESTEFARLSGSDVPSTSLVFSTNPGLLRFTSNGQWTGGGFTAEFACASPSYELRCGRDGQCSEEPGHCATLDEAHEVSCCSDTPRVDWKEPAGNCQVWGERDPSGGGCKHLDFAAAAAYCAEVGGRLCTASELAADCTSGTGCRHDDDLQWSSTPCIASGDDGSCSNDNDCEIVGSCDQGSCNYVGQSSTFCDQCIRNNDLIAFDAEPGVVQVESWSNVQTNETVGATMRLNGPTMNILTDQAVLAEFEHNFKQQVAQQVNIDQIRVHVRSISEASVVGGRRLGEADTIDIFVDFVIVQDSDGSSITPEELSSSLQQPINVLGMSSEPLSIGDVETYDSLEFCPPGFTDHDGDVTTPCLSCLPGYYADSVGHTGECTACPAGKFSKEQGASSSIACKSCGDDERGQQYSESGASSCMLAAEFFACPDPGRQWSDFERLHVSTPEGRHCSCRNGYYDAAHVEIRCWQLDRKDDPEDDVFNRDSLQDEAARRRIVEDMSKWASTCVMCPEDCVDCSRGSDWSNITIKEGFGLAAPRVEMTETYRTTVDIFTCPLDGACLGNLSLAQIFDGQDRLCDEKYLVEDPSSKKKIPFCAACSPGNILDANECSSCDHLRMSSVLIVGVLGAGMVIGLLASLRLMLCSHHFKAIALLLRLMWPRISQSVNLIITNYQILSGLPSRLRIPFPRGITRLLKSFTAIINIDILNLPGLACVVGSSYYTKFIANMLAPVLVILILRAISKWHIARLRTVSMPMPSDLDLDEAALDEAVGPKGSPERRRFLRHRVSFKVCRAIVASKIQAPYYALMCFIVFVRFPATSRIIFDMFRCRSVSAVDKSSLLEVNYRETCYTGTHIVFSVLGILFLCAYTFGIPVFLLFKLSSFKTTIQGQPASSDYKPAVGRKDQPGYTPQVGTAACPGNQNYIEIAAYKPLFQFYRPECFKFEIYFWMEKVMLVGFTEMFGSEIARDSTGLTQWLLNVTVTLGYLVLIAVYLPSKEPRYNVGNICMHIIILYFYIVSLLLNPRVNMKDSALNNLNVIDTSLVVTQLGLVFYLLLVSFWKMQQLWVQAKEQVHAEREAEERIEEHVTYFEKLRLHFSDEVAHSLTRMHYNGGFGSLVAEAAAKDAAAHPERTMTRIVNPLHSEANAQTP
eukprot:COSAG02_NODE_4411_length_5386_cov_8.551352_1_plen_1421_part_00